MNNEDIKNDLIRIYDDSAKEYGQEYNTLAGKHYMWKKIKQAISLGSFSKGDKILEIGCANGPYTFELAKLGFNVTGVDLSTQNIYYAKQKKKQLNIQNVNFKVADGEHLTDIKDEVFDGILSFSTIRYFPEPIKALKEMYRVLKREKAIVIDFPNKYSPWFKYIKPIVKNGKVHPHDNHYSSKYLKELISNAGFNDIKIKRILYTHKHFNPYILNLAKFIEIVGELPILNHFASIIFCRGVKE